MSMMTEFRAAPPEGAQTPEDRASRPAAPITKAAAEEAVRPGGESNKKAPRHLPREARGSILFGSAVVLGTFFGFGVWAAVAPLARAVAAPATVISEGRKRVVQHLEGGIIGQVLVREGDLVKEGQTLFRLDEVQAAARAERLRGQLLAKLAHAARLDAERDEAKTIRFPQEFDDTAANDVQMLERITRGETVLFNERRRSLAGQVELLQQKVVQLKTDIDGLNAQETSKQQQITLIRRELADLLPLLTSNLIPRPRYTALEREAARLEGEVGEVVSRRARANEGISEAGLQIEQLQRRFREEVVTQLREVETQIADLRHQYISARDVMSRLAITAPERGIAQSVNVSTIGAVIQPGQPLLEIAPTGSQLLVEAKVAPNDVHDVKLGLRAEVRFVSLDMRRTPAIYGTVKTLSGDRIIDQKSGQDYFLAQVQVPRDELAKLGAQHISPGIPAEVLIQTGSRSMLDYLMKPLTDSLHRGLNER